MFFIVKPEGNEKKTYRGEVSICKKDEKTGFKYFISGNGEKIKKIFKKIMENMQMQSYLQKIWKIMQEHRFR